ncbi:MAG: hypothetical protein QRY72_03055 [Candidatus Rhabdochlamydia sp.]
MRRAAPLASAPFVQKKLSFRWFLCLVACSAVAFGYLMKQKEESYQLMVNKLKELEQEREKALCHQEELRLQIQSQSDPLWVEMVLKRQLGMVSQGQTKIYFHNNS